MPASCALTSELKESPIKVLGMTSAVLASRFRTAHADESCTDLNQVIARAERSIAEIVGPSVSVQFALSPNAVRVALPMPELEQILLGMCVASRALLCPGGRLVIESRGVNDAHFAPISGVALVGTDAFARVLVRAEPLGHASPSAAPRAAAALEFSALEARLEHVGGRLELVPMPDNGLSCVAHLPYAPSAESSGYMAVAVPQQAGSILLVEDEPQVQAVTARILRAFGFSVITAHNERTALAQAEQYGASIGLVVSDLVLPGVSGKDLVRRLKKPCEHARVLYISGYSPDHVGPLTDGACFLRKPFTAQELRAIVCELLPEAAH